jgi:hypothetical protein
MSSNPHSCPDWWRSTPCPRFDGTPLDQAYDNHTSRSRAATICPGAVHGSHAVGEIARRFAERSARSTGIASSTGRARSGIDIGALHREVRPHVARVAGRAILLRMRKGGKRLLLLPNRIRLR